MTGRIPSSSRDRTGGEPPPYERRDLWAIGALLLVSSLACVHLTALPVFEDEGSQLRMIFRIIAGGGWLEPLLEGKPLEVWPMIPLVLLPVQPIVATRAVHVVLGMTGTALVYDLASQLTTRRVAFASTALFAICPFVVYLQRIALSDIGMCTAGLWVATNVLRFVATPSRSRSGLLAASLLLAAFTKFPVGFVFVAWTPLALLLMPGERRAALLVRPALGRMLLAHGPVIALAVLVMTIAGLRARSGRPPGFGLDDVIGIAFGRYGADRLLGAATPTLTGELAVQLSWLALVLGLVGLVVSAAHADWRRRWLIVIGALPLLAIGLLAQFWYSRYLLFTLPPLIIVAVDGWSTLSRRVGRLGTALAPVVLAVCAVLFARQSIRIIIDPASARWSAADRLQYFEGWSSGYGYPEAAQFIGTAPAAPAHIYALDGHSAWQLRNYMPAARRNRIGTIFYGPEGQSLLTAAGRLQNLQSHTPAWIVVAPQILDGYLQSSFGRAGPAPRDLRRIAVFDKPGGKVQLALYEVSSSAPSVEVRP